MIAVALIVVDAIALVVVGTFATAAVRSTQRRAEREQARHEAAALAWAEERAALIEGAKDERRELSQTIAYLGHRGGPPQAWARPPLEEEAALAERIAPASVLMPDELPVPYEDEPVDFVPESNGRVM